MMLLSVVWQWMPMGFLKQKLIPWEAPKWRAHLNGSHSPFYVQDPQTWWHQAPAKISFVVKFWWNRILVNLLILLWVLKLSYYRIYFLLAITFCWRYLFLWHSDWVLFLPIRAKQSSYTAAGVTIPSFVLCFISATSTGIILYDLSSFIRRPFPCKKPWLRMSLYWDIHGFKMGMRWLPPHENLLKCMALLGSLHHLNLTKVWNVVFLRSVLLSVEYKHTVCSPPKVWGYISVLPLMTRENTVVSIKWDDSRSECQEQNKNFLKN